MKDHKFQGNLKNGEGIFTDINDHIYIEKDHTYLVLADPDEEKEARKIMGGK